jgi:hypothetical protein
LTWWPYRYLQQIVVDAPRQATASRSPACSRARPLLSNVPERDATYQLISAANGMGQPQRPRVARKVIGIDVGLCKDECLPARWHGDDLESGRPGTGLAS